LVEISFDLYFTYFNVHMSGSNQPVW